MVYFVLKLVIENKLNLDNIITEYLQNNELHKDLIKDGRHMDQAIKNSLDYFREQLNSQEQIVRNFDEYL